MPIHQSNVAIFNAATGKADRVGIKALEDGSKVRVFKSSGAEIKVAGETWHVCKTIYRDKGRSRADREVRLQVPDASAPPDQDHPEHGCW